MNRLSEFWLKIIGDTGLIGVAIAFLIVLYYEIRLLTSKSQVKKYEYASSNEVRYFKTASVFFTISITFFIFELVTKVIGLVKGFEYFFIAFISVGIGSMIGYSLYMYFKVYYPFILEKKLSRIRFKTRVSPKTGNEMRLLNELEEDAHLSQEMIDQELNFTYDYDVWIDEESGDKLIERYDGHLHALICPICNFRTLKDYKEKIIKSPTPSEKGLLKKYYKCSYCSHAETREVPIAQIENEKIEL